MSEELWLRALPAITALAGTLVGILAGWLAGRGKERRDMRLAAYVEWLRAARSLGTWPLGYPQPPAGSNIELPHPTARTRLNDATVELELVGSEDVVAAAKAFLDRLAETIPQAMGGQMRIEEASDRFNSLMTPERKRVVAAMRRDLKTKR